MTLRRRQVRFKVFGKNRIKLFWLGLNLRASQMVLQVCFDDIAMEPRWESF